MLLRYKSLASLQGLNKMYLMPSEADGICGRGMCSSPLHNLYDTTQYGEKKKTRGYEHLAYFEILSGGYKMTENQFLCGLICLKPVYQEIVLNLSINENG